MLSSIKRALFTFSGRVPVRGEAIGVVAGEKAMALAIAEESDGADRSFAVHRKFNEKVSKVIKGRGIMWISIMRRLINGLSFYFGWWFCMDKATGDTPYYGPLIIALILIFHLALSSARVLDFILMVSFAFLGMVIDTIYVQSGLMVFKGGYDQFPYVAPLWVVSLWALYASSINHSLDWLNYNLLLAAALGAMGAASSYLVGIELGAAVPIWSKNEVLAVIALVWAFVVPLSLSYSRWLKTCLCPVKQNDL